MDRIPIYLGLMLVALAGMATTIVDVHAWNCGVEKFEPWRRRISAAIARTLSSVLRRFCIAHWPALAVASLVIICLLVHPPHAAAATSPLMVAGKLALPEMRESRAKLVTDMRGIIEKAEVEKRGLTADDNAKLEKMKADATELRRSIVNLEELETEERLTGAPESQRQEPRTKDEARAYEERRAALMSFCYGQVTAEQRSTLQGVAKADVFKPNPHAIVIGPTDAEMRFEREQQRLVRPLERRSQNTLSLAAGGAVVAPDVSMYGRIVEALKFFGGMESVGAEVLTTETGADLPIATDDDTSNTGMIVAEEGDQSGGANATMGQAVLHAYLYSSKIVKVSWQLLQDSSFDIEAYIGRKLGMRLGRIQNTHCTTGTGVNQPQGVVTAATVGRQSAAGNTATVAADDVLRVIRSVDVAYRTAACRFMMSDSSALQYELLKDTNGQYIWRMGGGFNGLNDTPSDSLRGYRVVINNDMPAMGANAKHTSFGDHSYYKIRRVRAIQIVRLNELFAGNGQVGFLAFMRADGGLVDAGEHPVKLLQNSAT